MQPMAWKQEPGDFEKLQESLKQSAEGGAGQGEPYLIACPVNPKTSKRLGAVAFLRGAALDSGPLGLAAILGPGVWHLQAHNGKRGGAVVALSFEGAPRRLLWESPLILQGEPASVPRPWGDAAQDAAASPAPVAAAAPGPQPAAPDAMAALGQMAQLMAGMRAIMPAPPPPPPPPPPDPLAQMRTMAEMVKMMAPPAPPPSLLERHAPVLIPVVGSVLSGAMTAGLAAASGLAPYLVDAVVGKRKADMADKVLGFISGAVDRFMTLAEKQDAEEEDDDGAPSPAAVTHDGAG